MSNNLPSINLVKNKQVPILDKFLNWVLTVGRLIVIITEIVAVSAFIYRFSLDERLSDIHSAIKQKQNIVSVLKNDEAKYRNLQERIAVAASFLTKNGTPNKTVSDIVGLIPSSIKISNLVINKKQVSLTITVSSISTLSNFVDSLKNYSDMKSISIDSIENRPSVGLSVDITAILK
jgi:hypothetical protein